MNNDKNIPYFEDEENKMLEGVPVIERENVEVFLLDRATNKILCLDWEKFGWKSIIIGGIEKDETAEQAARKEIREETGYTNVSFISEIGMTKSGYFAKHKNENRIANTTGLFFELVNHEKMEVHPDELAKHTPIWIPVDEVSGYLTITAQKYLWDKLKEII